MSIHRIFNHFTHKNVIISTRKKDFNRSYLANANVTLVIGLINAFFLTFFKFQRLL